MEADPRTAHTTTEWAYVGQGRGAYASKSQIEFVGEGRGEYAKEAALQHVEQLITVDHRKLWI